MSLCVLLRDSDGSAVMAADTALTVEICGTDYRVEGREDSEKIVNCHGNLLFISGILDFSEELRKIAKEMNQLDMKKFQLAAIRILGSGKYKADWSKDDVIVLACLEDNRVALMRASKGFERIEWQNAPTDNDGMVITTAGAKAEAAFHNAMSFAKDTECGAPLIIRTFDSVLCEGVGGDCHIIKRFADGHMVELTGRLHDRGDIKKVKIRPHGVVHATNGVFNGEVHAKKGDFDGIIKARDFLLPSGDSLVSVLNEKGQIRGDFIDAKGMRVIGDSGEIVLNIDKTGIHWPAKYSPIRYQYAASASGPWHDTQFHSDEYRRESFDGGVTWGSGIKFVARDGAPGSNGSDASVTYNNIRKALQKASGTTSAYLTMDEVGAPEIYGGKIYGSEFHGSAFNVYFDDEGIPTSQDGFNLYGTYNGTPYHFLQIRYDEGDAPIVSLFSPDNAYLEIGKDASWNGVQGYTRFRGKVDFSGADVDGIVARFA